MAWAKEAGITGGTSDTTFSPKSSVTRAQAVTFLWAAAGRPEPASSVSPFVDVPSPGVYYYKPVLWAKEKGITSGVSAGLFGVTDAVHYDQFLAFLCRAAGGELSGDWSQAAMSWAASKGLTSGLNITAGNDCPRGDVVYFLWKQYGGGASKPVQTASPDRPVINTESGLNGKICAKEDFDMSVYAVKAHIMSDLVRPEKIIGFDSGKPKTVLVVVSGNYGIDRLVDKELINGYKFDIYDYRNGVYTFIAQYDTQKCEGVHHIKAEEVPANPIPTDAMHNLTPNASGFTDLKEGDPYYTAIMNFTKKDIIAGYADGRFGADDPIMAGERNDFLARLKNLKHAKPASETSPREYDRPVTRANLLELLCCAPFNAKANPNLTIDQIPAEDAAKLRAYAAEHPIRVPGKMTDEQLKKGIEAELKDLVRAYSTGYLSSVGGLGDLGDWVTRGELCQLFYEAGCTDWGSLK